jgi:hypothetical protein
LITKLQINKEKEQGAALLPEKENNQRTQ